MLCCCAALSVPGRASAEPGPAVDAAVQGALRFLSSRQHADGSWKLGAGGSPIGTTSYCLIAFLAAGETPSDGIHRDSVRLAVAFLSSSVNEDGLIYRKAFGQFPHNLYDQGIATLALAQTCAITNDDALRPKLQRASRFILGCQDALGGWRYKPVSQDRPDLPVTACQLVALSAVRAIGIDVPQSAIDRGVAFLKRCHDDRTGGFAYAPNGPKTVGFSRTASALYALEVCGLGESDLVKRGSAILFLPPTNVEREEQGLWFSYGRYQAAFAQYLVRGPTWQRWRRLSREALLNTAKRADGAVWWEDPASNPPDPVYITALDATILALPGNHLRLSSASAVGRCCRRSDRP